RRARPRVHDVHRFQAPHVGHVLVAAQHDVHPGFDEDLQHVTGVVDDASFPSGAGNGDQVVVDGKDLQLGGGGKLLADPRVPLAADLAVVQVGLARVGAHDPHTVDVGGPVAGADELLEVKIADITGVVVSGNGHDGSLDAVPVRHPVLVLLPIALVGEMPGAHVHVWIELCQLYDHAILQDVY